MGKNNTMENVLSKVVEAPGPLDTPCWLWTGGLRPNGYGRVSWDNKGVGVHRLVYEYFKGPIPEGLQTDHLCRIRHCVNPDHLEAVTPQTNVRRSESVCAINAKKTHCPLGHPYTPENTHIDKHGKRNCKTCARLRQAEYQARLRAEKIERGEYVLPSAAKTHCPSGHEYTPENTLIHVSGGRRCRECHRKREADRHKRLSTG